MPPSEHFSEIHRAADAGPEGGRSGGQRPRIGGGYRLTREPDQYTLWEILRLAEGDLAPVACLQSGAAPCARAADCRTLSVWDGYYKLSREYFSGVTLADLMREPRTSDYVI